MIFSKETGDNHMTTDCSRVKTSLLHMAGSSHGKKIRRLKRKIRLQASEHAQDIQKYESISEELKFQV